MQLELEADSFLTSLTHGDDPKATERAEAPFETASDASVDDAAFTSFDPPQEQPASGQSPPSFDAINAMGAQVTDDEFNELFGPAE